MATVTLSTGEVVTLRERLTHNVHKAIFSARNKDVKWGQNLETGEWEKFVPANQIEFEFEAAMPLVIEKIELNGQTKPFTPEWMGDLLQEDFSAIERAFNDLRTKKTEDGEKK